jgi:hypothetical protein
MSGGAKLCMRAFKMLATTGAVVWTLLNWESITANWEDISDLWEG